MSKADEEQVLELRDQVMSVWAMLSSSKGFDPAVLQPLFSVVQERKAQQFGQTVASGIATKLTARAVRDLLRISKPDGASASTPSTSLFMSSD